VACGVVVPLCWRFIPMLENMPPLLGAVEAGVAPLPNKLPVVLFCVFGVVAPLAFPALPKSPPELGAVDAAPPNKLPELDAAGVALPKRPPPDDVAGLPALAKLKPDVGADGADEAGVCEPKRPPEGADDAGVCEPKRPPPVLGVVLPNPPPLANVPPNRLPVVWPGVAPADVPGVLEPKLKPLPPVFPPPPNGFC
jgi:hypothetical protein